METALIVGAVLISGLTCPAMMWWQRRRGREAACCAPADAAASGRSTVEQLRRRSESISARLAELGGGAEGFVLQEDASVEVTRGGRGLATKSRTEEPITAEPDDGDAVAARPLTGGAGNYRSGPR